MQAIAEHVEMKGGQHAIFFHPTTHPITLQSSTNWNLAYNPFQMMFKAFLRSDFQAGTILTNLLNPSLLRPTVLHIQVR